MVRNEWPLSRAKNSHQILHEVKQNLKWGTWHVKGGFSGSRKRAASWHQEHSQSSGTRLKWGHHLQDWWKSEKVRTGVCTNRQFSASMMTEDFSKGGRTDLFGDSTAGGEFLPHTCGAFDSWPGTARAWRLPGSLRGSGTQEKCGWSSSSLHLSGLFSYRPWSGHAHGRNGDSIHFAECDQNTRRFCLGKGVVTWKDRKWGSSCVLGVLLRKEVRE